MAYVYIPILFTLMGYGLIYLATAPVVQLMKSTLDVILVEETSEHEYVLKTIYDAKAAQITESFQENVSQFVADKAPLNESESEITQIDHTIQIKNIQFPKLGEHYAMLSCTRIQLEVPVYWGDTQKILSAGVGHFMGSFLPGFQRSILLSGHNNTYFKTLEAVKVGDIINYATNYGEFQYEIDEVSILTVADAEKMLERLLTLNEEKLILYTCYPFHLTNKKEKRLFVFGNKISGPEVEK